MAEASKQSADPLRVPLLSNNKTQRSRSRWCWLRRWSGDRSFGPGSISNTDVEDSNYENNRIQLDSSSFASCCQRYGTPNNIDLIEIESVDEETAQWMVSAVSCQHHHLQEDSAVPSIESLQDDDASGINSPRKQETESQLNEKYQKASATALIAANSRPDLITDDLIVQENGAEVCCSCSETTNEKMLGWAVVAVLTITATQWTVGIMIAMSRDEYR